MSQLFIPFTQIEKAHYGGNILVLRNTMVNLPWSHLPQSMSNGLGYSLTKMVKSIPFLFFFREYSPSLLKRSLEANLRYILGILYGWLLAS